MTAPAASTARCRRRPTSLARAAADAVAAGAFMVHVHPRDESGRETLETRHVVDAVVAIRAATPGLRVSVSTRDGIVDSARRKARPRVGVALARPRRP